MKVDGQDNEVGYDEGYIQLAQAPTASHLEIRGEVMGETKDMRYGAETPRWKGEGGDCGLGPQASSGDGV